MLIDHIIYAAPDLEEAAADIEQRFGVSAAYAGQHAGQGTHNMVLALGPRTYLEIIAPDPEQPEPSAPRPHGVDGVTQGRLVGWALACGDIEKHAQRLVPGASTPARLSTATESRPQARCCNGDSPAMR
jgi:Glyoxalase-like domain